MGTLLQLEAALDTKRWAVPEFETIGAVPTIVFNDVINHSKSLRAC